MTSIVLMLLAAAAGAAVQGLRALTGGVPQHTSAPSRMTAAGIPLPVAAYLALVTAAALGGAAMVFAVTARPVPALVVAVGVSGALVWPLMRAGRLTRARIRSQLPLLADHLADSVAAGLSLTQAIRSAPDAIGGPLGVELARTARAIDLGERTDVALDALAARVGEPPLEVMMSAIAVQRACGGDLGGSLSRLARQLGDGEKLSHELQTATAQARMTGGLVAALPIAAGVALELARPGAVASLLNGPGLPLVAVSLLLQALGLLLIRRVSRVAT